MTIKKKILITGMSGLIGGMAGCHLFGQGHKIRALNRRKEAVVESFEADIKNLDQIRSAFDDVDVVLHFSAYLGQNDDWSKHLDTNIIGCYNVFEAARLAGVKNFIFASSGATQSFYTSEEPIKSSIEARWKDLDKQEKRILDYFDPPRPGDIYGASKVWGETLGRLYSDKYGMSVICIRIGRVTKENIPTSSAHAAVYCSHRDLNQIIEKSVNKIDQVKFEVIYAVSDNKGRFRDISNAKKIIGYEPLDGIKEWPLNE